jgi:DNA-binding MarR family transcriptional regulator
MAEIQENSPRQVAAPGDQEPQEERLLRGSREVLELTVALAKELERLRLARARSVGLRPPGHVLLGLVAQAGEAGLTVSDAALALGVRPQALSGPVAELVEESLLEREVDLSDGRARRLRATQLGLGRLGPSQELEQQVLREIMAQIPQPTVAKLVLGRLQAALRQVLGQPGRPGGGL